MRSLVSRGAKHSAKSTVKVDQISGHGNTFEFVVFEQDWFGEALQDKRNPPGEIVTVHHGDIHLTLAPSNGEHTP